MKLMQSDGEGGVEESHHHHQLWLHLHGDRGPIVQTEKQEISALFTLGNLGSNQPVII